MVAGLERSSVANLPLLSIFKGTAWSGALVSEPLTVAAAIKYPAGAKLVQKMDYRHSGYPGGLRATSYTELLANDPQRAVEKAIKGMLPHNKLGRAQIKKLKVYAGSEHPHAAQQPQPFVITQVAQ